jgi:hypothetical protein
MWVPEAKSLGSDNNKHSRISNYNCLGQDLGMGAGKQQFRTFLAALIKFYSRSSVFLATDKILFKTCKTLDTVVRNYNASRRRLR